MKNPLNNFWLNLKQPIIGLSPMDGVTDATFRAIVDKHGQPQVLFTEFAPVEGLVRGIDKLLYAFISHQTPTPTVAQIFGTDITSFYQAAHIAAEMGFSGVDINMGCPDKNISKRGAGAALIKNPRHAQKIIKTVKQSLSDWAEGSSLKKIGAHENIVHFVKKYQKKNNLKRMRSILPVSVKTRIGFDKIVTSEWISQLLEAGPVVISVHGRTLKQLYSGQSCWEEIEKAALLARQTQTLLLGNGDITSLPDALNKVKKYHTHGALIGRSALGNPWVFKNTSPTPTMRCQTALEHCRIFQQLTPELNFLNVRKHLGWYLKSCPHASKTRMQLMQAKTVPEVELIIESYKNLTIDSAHDIVNI